MEQKKDLRVQKTYKALATSLFQLLKQKPFEDITVKELCDLAVVRRATFYKHFGDKYEFAIFIIRQLQSEFYATNIISSDGIRSKAFYIDVLRKTILFIDQNEKLIFSILESNKNTLLIDTLSEEISYNLNTKLQEDLQNGAKLPTNTEILANFFTGAILQTVRWWIQQKDRISEEELTKQLITLLNMF